LKGRFGIYGGRYVSEVLMHALIELEEAFEKIYPSPNFRENLQNC